MKYEGHVIQTNEVHAISPRQIAQVDIDHSVHGSNTDNSESECHVQQETDWYNVPTGRMGDGTCYVRLSVQFLRCFYCLSILTMFA